KTIRATKSIMPSGDIDKDIREIKLYFKNFTGKHPELFDLGLE
ncbi:MAG: acyltransferase, partial [Bacteroides sp.]|nr:acyltransferase [Bacteroides sp.]